MAVGKPGNLILIGLEGVDLVEGRAWAIDVDEAEALVVDAREDQVGEFCRFGGEASGNEGRAAGDGQGHRVERLFGVACRGGGGMEAGTTGGRCLPLGQPIDGVVHDDVGEVQIAAHRMDKVARADGEGITVTGEDEGLEVGAGNPDAGGNRSCATVHAVEPIRRDEVGDA